MKFTIFTPTYNRAYILPKLYNSLISQSVKDFEWLVVDDGSTDNTENLVNGFIKENKIDIRYYKQENQGKHIAINTALDLAKGTYFLIIDSDDYIVDNCVEVISKLADKVSDKEDFAGFTFIRFSESTPFTKSEYGNKEWVDEDYHWEYHGEMIFAFKTDIAKNFKFPVFKDEKFCQEAVFLRPIMRKYKFLYTDNVLAHGDYLEDGLSQDIYKKLLQNPKYALLATKEKFLTSKTKQEKLYSAKVFWDIANKTGGGIKNIFNLPLYYTFLIYFQKIHRRLLTKN